MPLDKNDNSLNWKKIILFWTPLSFTWLMMSMEAPFITAIIGRIVEAKYNLASYGVAFSIAMLIEAPVVMILSASVALVNSKKNYIKLRNFILTIIVSVTLLHIFINLPFVFGYISGDVLKLDPKIASLAHSSSIIMIPWAGAIGYRRFYQGILIRMGQTKKVAAGTFVRLFFMTATGLFLFLFTDIPGACVGAASLSVGVILESAATRIMAIKAVKKVTSGGEDQKLLSLSDIVKFYYPLALTSYLILGINPILTFFMAKGKMPVESLAVLPVINAFIFIFRSFGLSFQEAALALLGKNYDNFIPLRNFALVLGILTSSLAALVSVTTLSLLWFKHVSFLSEELLALTLFPTVVLSIMPSLTTLLAWQRSVLVNSRLTYPITIATALEVIAIGILMTFSAKILNPVAIYSAAVSVVLGRALANLYLYFPYRKIVFSHGYKPSFYRSYIRLFDKVNSEVKT
ncbi:hypothetical protein JXA84_01910 [candidate division WOR-3 bacterium]|nr:hypothetical protein [candidate division WOR-3 bacterium]